MSNNIKEYSGTGEFPAVPTEQSAKRPAFVMQPWLSEVSCPGLEGVPENVVPSFRAAPLIEQPASAVWSGLPTPELTPPPESCIPFFPKTIVTMRVGGRVWYGNQLVQASGCSLMQRMHIDINPSTGFLVGPAIFDSAHPERSDADLIATAKAVWVNSGLITYAGEAGNLVTRWPSGKAGNCANLEDGNVQDVLAAGLQGNGVYPPELTGNIAGVDCEIEGNGMLGPSAQTPFGKIVEYDRFVNFGAEISGDIREAHPAGQGRGARIDLPTAGGNLVLPAFVYWEPPDDPPSVGATSNGCAFSDPGSVKITSNTADIVGQLLAVIDKECNVIQVSSSVITPVPDTTLFKVSNWKDSWKIYLGEGEPVWVSGDTSANMDADAGTGWRTLTGLSTGSDGVRNDIYALLIKGVGVHKRDTPSLAGCSVALFKTTLSTVEATLHRTYPGSYKKIASIIDNSTGKKRHQNQLGQIIDDPMPIATKNNQLVRWDNDAKTWKADYLRWTE